MGQSRSAAKKKRKNENKKQKKKRRGRDIFSGPLKTQHDLLTRTMDIENEFHLKKEFPFIKNDVII